MKRHVIYTRVIADRLVKFILHVYNRPCILLCLFTQQCMFAVYATWKLIFEVI